MSVADLVVPVILCFVACFALRERVDVYGALTKGAEEGLTVLVRILPSLVGLLTAVYMFRASGAMEYLARFLSPLLGLLGIPPESAPLPEMGRMNRSGAHSGGIPSSPSRGERNRARYSIAPDARNI